jgi:hypothetical protein
MIHTSIVRVYRETRPIKARATASALTPIESFAIAAKHRRCVAKRFPPAFSALQIRVEK